MLKSGLMIVGAILLSRGAQLVEFRRTAEAAGDAVGAIGESIGDFGAAVGGIFTSQPDGPSGRKC